MSAPDPPARPRTPLTWTLLGLWVAAYLGALVVGGGFRPTGGAWWTFGGPHLGALVRMGAVVPELVRAGEWPRLLTASFLHLFVLHLALNAWVWTAVGRLLETAVGSLRTGIVFGVAALGGSLAHVELGHGLAAGASGGVFGAVGALGVWALGSRHPLAPAAGRTAIMFLLLSAILLLVPGVGHEAHLGGLAAGGLTMVVLGPRRSLRPAGLGTGFAAALVLVAFATAAVLQARGERGLPAGDARTLLEELQAAERLAQRLHRRPDLVRPAQRRELDAHLDALLEAPWLDEWPGADALRAYVEAWRPVARGDVPDPFAFEARLQAARDAWAPHAQSLRVYAGQPP